MEIGVSVKFKNSPDFPRPWLQLYEESIAYAKAADRLGFDYIVGPEHHSVAAGYNPAPFVTLAAIARETERIRLATQPLLLPLYNPVMVAEQLAALDVISGGRAMLGVGVGYRDGDFEALGIPKRERGARMEENLTILLGALEQRDFSYDGKFHQVRGVDIMPRPLQEPRPKVFVTAPSEVAVERAVRFGLPINTLHVHATQNGIYDYYCARVLDAGLDPSSLDVSVLREGYIAADRDTAIRIAAPYVEANIARWKDAAYAGRDATAGERTQETLVASDGTSVTTRGELIGTPADWIDAIRVDRELLDGPVPFGAYTLGLWTEGMPLEHGIAALEIFAAEVLPWAHGQGQ